MPTTQLTVTATPGRPYAQAAALALQSAEILDTSRSNTAQTGTANTITLDASASATDDYYNLCRITITGGTGSGQSRRITDYVGSTKVATVDENWTSTPDATSTFTISSGSHLALTYNGAATYTSGQITLNGSIPLFGKATGRSFTTKSVSPVVRGDGTSTIVFSTEIASEYHGLGKFAIKSETVTIDVPNGLISGAGAETGFSCTNNSQETGNGTCRLRGPIPYSITSGTIDIEAEAYTPFGTVTGITYAVSDGANPDVTGSLTANQVSSIDNYRVWKASSVDVSSLNDGQLTVSVTASYSWTASTRADSYVIFNNYGGTLVAATTTYYIKGTSGNDTTGDGSAGNPYKTIGKSFDVARSAGKVGATFIIAENGTYDIHEGNGGSTWTPTQPVIIKPDTGITVTIADLNFNAQDSIRTSIHQSSVLWFENVTINLTKYGNTGQMAQIYHSHVLYNSTVTHGASSPNYGSVSTPIATGCVAYAYSSTYTSIIKAFISFARAVNCQAIDTGSDVATNTPYVSNVRFARRSWGSQQFTVQYTGSAGSATVELSGAAPGTPTGGTLTLREDGTPVATFDCNSASYDTVSELVAGINGVTDWTATDLHVGSNPEIQSSTKVIFDFSATDCKTEALTIYCVTTDHSDMCQLFGSAYSNVIISGLRCIASYDTTPGLNTVLQVFWLDHAGPLKIDGLAIINCADVTWGTSGGTRSGIHGDIRDALFAFNTAPDNQLNLIYKGGGTALSEFSPTNVVLAYNFLYAFAAENGVGSAGTGADCYIATNHYSDTTPNISGTDYTTNATIGNAIATYNRPNFSFIPKLSSDLLSRTVIDPGFGDATGLDRTAGTIGAFEYTSVTFLPKTMVIA